MKGINLPELKLNTDYPISRQIYTFLRQLITDISIKPGTRLSENVLSKHFNVSRQPVREALFQLKRCGLIEVFPQIGSYVKKISLINLQETCFVRSSIEMNSIMQGLKRHDDSFEIAMENIANTIKIQRELLDNPDIADRDGEFLILDDEFHKHICELSGTSMSWDVVWDIKANLDRIRYLSTRKISKIDNLIDEHQQIYDLIKANKPLEAMGVIHEHLYEITKTSIPICLENAEWFMPEDVAKLQDKAL